MFQFGLRSSALLVVRVSASSSFHRGLFRGSTSHHRLVVVKLPKSTVLRSSWSYRLYNGKDTSCRLCCSPPCSRHGHWHWRYVFSKNKLYTLEPPVVTGFSETHTLLISLEHNHLRCYFLLFYQRIFKILQGPANMHWQKFHSCLFSHSWNTLLKLLKSMSSLEMIVKCFVVVLWNSWNTWNSNDFETRAAVHTTSMWHAHQLECQNHGSRAHEMCSWNSWNLTVLSFANFWNVLEMHCCLFKLLTKKNDSKLMVAWSICWTLLHDGTLWQHVKGSCLRILIDQLHCWNVFDSDLTSSGSEKKVEEVVPLMCLFWFSFGHFSKLH